MQKNFFLSRFLENKLAIICFVLLAALVLFSFVGALFLTYSPDQIDYYNALIPPWKSIQHPLGTDDLGRDVLARLAYGGRISLGLGISVALTGSVLGTLLGASAGFFRGWVDTVISRLIDILMALPQLALLLVISGFITIQPIHLALVMSLLGWMGVARLVRSEVLRLREMEFVQAAQVIGVPPGRIVLRHILPNVLAPVTVAATLAVAYTILAESALSYLGFGVHPPTPTWGNMLQGAQRYMRTAPWLAIIPGIFIALTVTCFNFIGDALREAIDPRLKGRV
jgi:peptide/nickel transport system permease protein